MALRIGISALVLAPSAIAISTGNPVSKVVTMIKDMKTQVEKEAEEDEAAYEKYHCWCVNNDKEKTEAIESAGNRLDELAATIEESAALEGELKTQVEALTSDIEEDKTALETAESIREGENTEFVASEKEMKETLDALGNAIEVLEKVNLLQKHNGAAKVSVPLLDAQSLLQVHRAVQTHFPQYKEVMQRDLFDVLGSINKLVPTLRGAALAQDPTTGGAAKGAKSYNSRSGAIFGILGGMQDQFTRDLANAQKSEAAASEAFAKLKEAKTGEIAAAEKQIRDKQAELTQVTHKSAMAKKETAKLQKAKAADEEFLMNLKKGCAKEDQNYNDRVKVRSDEVIALSETIEILTGDDARDLFSKTTSFLQVSSTASSAAARERAMRRMATVARRHKNSALAALAVRVKLDAFDKVKKTMDNMLAELKTQQQDELEKKELCDKQIDEAEDDVKVATQTQADLNAKHKSLTNDLATTEEDIAKLKSDVEADEISLKQAGAVRREENSVYSQSVMDARATIVILNKALARMKDFYGGAALVEIKAHIPGAASSAPPPTPKGFTKSAGAGGVLQMLKRVITDTEMDEQELVVSENNAQEEFAQLVRDTTASLEADKAAIAEKEEMKANAAGEKSETQEAQLANDQELEKAKQLLSAFHTDCDWIIKYFDLRQEARQEEMDSIEEAKAILSGADFGK